ncbi:MAG: hypothetical protein CMM76_12090 [Rhodospirillaceae bacterium]|nr:hypothetical protein [Rhodospirillaceae bacterium]
MARLRDKLMNIKTFYTLREAKIVIEQQRWHYKTKLLHSALGYKSPAPESIISMLK